MTATAFRVVGSSADAVAVADLAADGNEIRRRTLSPQDVHALGREDDTVRWVWSDTARWYPPFLEQGITLQRCHDLRLVHAILRDSASVADAGALRAAEQWDAPAESEQSGTPTLFELDDGARRAPHAIDATLEEFHRQQEALSSAAHAGRLRLLAAAESAGALIAAELHAAGVPWSADRHDQILVEMLGERSSTSVLPQTLVELREQVRGALGDPQASLDSQPKLLRALHRAGIPAQSTGRWELRRFDHPAIAPLIEYRQLSRLLQANGWAWLETWVRDRRFRPVYVPGGVVTGRWASSGGGALQIPRMLRAAVVADPGWTLVSADVAQLEPRVLAAMSSDHALADAARARDLYQHIADDGTVPTRADAKIAILGAMYGATTGDSARLLPALRRRYPRAMRLVDDAAARGEAGEVVSTWLGRTCPAPSERWRREQQDASAADAPAVAGERARARARDRGRFTRNFVVQGTAAEWSLAWLAEIRKALTRLGPVAQAAPSHSGAAFESRPHLAFFLHDEVIVHTPLACADDVAEVLRSSADEAARLLFGDFPADFPLDVQIGPVAAEK